MSVHEVVPAPAEHRIARDGPKRRRWVSVTILIVLWVVFVAVNERLNLLNPVLVPTPMGLINAAREQLRQGILWPDIYWSLVRVYTGFLLAAAVAVPLGVLAGRVRWLEDLMDPILEGLRPIPPLAWLPLFIMWLGIGEQSKIFFTAFVAFFPIYVNVIEGVKYTEPIFLRAAQSLGAKQRQLFFHVVLPAALPSIITGLRLGFGMAFLALVSSELLGATAGLGYRIMEARTYFRVNWMVFGALVIGVVGYLSNMAVRYLEMRVLRWRARDE